METVLKYLVVPLTFALDCISTYVYLPRQEICTELIYLGICLTSIPAGSGAVCTELMSVQDGLSSAATASELLAGYTESAQADRATERVSSSTVSDGYYKVNLILVS